MAGAPTAPSPRAQRLAAAQPTPRRLWPPLGAAGTLRGRAKAQETSRARFACQWGPGWGRAGAGCATGQDLVLGWPRKKKTCLDMGTGSALLGTDFFLRSRVLSAAALNLGKILEEVLLYYFFLRCRVFSAVSVNLPKNPEEDAFEHLI